MGSPVGAATEAAVDEAAVDETAVDETAGIDDSGGDDDEGLSDVRTDGALVAPASSEVSLPQALATSASIASKIGFLVMKMLLCLAGRTANSAWSW